METILLYVKRLSIAFVLIFLLFSVLSLLAIGTKVTESTLAVLAITVGTIWSFYIYTGSPMIWGNSGGVKVVIAVLSAIMMNFIFFGGMYIITTTRQQQEVARWQVSIMRNIQSHENQWVSDIVGGDTPEETLRMYVNALEEKNFELASQYWYTERRSDILEQLNSKVGRISVREVRESFIQNYRDGVYEGKIINSKTDDTVEMYRATFSERESGKFLMAVTLIKNPFTEKWKMYL